MNTDLALIMALPNESKGLFEQAGIQVHYSGIGKINAAFKAFEVIHKTGCKTLINLGSAGSSHFDAHSLVEVVTFVQRDMDVSPLGFAVGVTPMDDEFPAEIHAQPHFEYLAKGVCAQETPLKPAFPKSRVNLAIWRPMPWQRAGQNFKCAWFPWNSLPMAQTILRIWIGKTTCC